MAQLPTIHAVIKLNKYYSSKEHDLLQEYSSVIRKGALRWVESATAKVLSSNTTDVQLSLEALLLIEKPPVRFT